MTIPSIVLVGAGGHGVACADVIEQEGRFAIAGFVGRADQVGTRLDGYEVIGCDDDLPALRREHAHALVTVGQIESPAPRRRLYDALIAGGWTRPVVVSPRAYRSPHCAIGDGTIIMHGAIVNTRASVGENCIVNSAALVEHDAVVGDHCHIATGAVLNGRVRVGTGSFVGSGTVVRQAVAIGARCLIGMGQRVLKDCPDDTRVPQAERGP